MKLLNSGLLPAHFCKQLCFMLPLTYFYCKENSWLLKIKEIFGKWWRCRNKWPTWLVCNYTGWDCNNLSKGGGWHCAKGLVWGDSLWLTTGPWRSILPRYCTPEKQLNVKKNVKKKVFYIPFTHCWSHKHWSHIE